MDYDVVIIGGLLSGASAAILLLWEGPGLRALVVERSTKFSRRAGEISGYFLERALGMANFLNESQRMELVDSIQRRRCECRGRFRPANRKVPARRIKHPRPSEEISFTASCFAQWTWLELTAGWRTWR